MNILVTGFEPFGGEAVNPSWEAVRRLPAHIDGVTVTTVQLPTAFQRGEQALLRALEDCRPERVLCVGLAGGRKGFTLERVGINLRDARIPDNDGFQPEDRPVRPDGPAAYFATLPVKDMVLGLNRADIPAAVSYSAGTYVCNDILYTLLDWQAREMPDARGGFVHLPYTREQAAAKGADVPWMSLDEMVRGLELAVRLASGESR
ncbi:MAG: pyroglutamyl-peptidase I [Clostridiales bacterium]|nr:pyroglutamyl-peptidase I [Clostridiales bacterium]